MVGDADRLPAHPPGMPASYQLLMQHCWATELSARPTITRVLECLDYMVREKQQAAAGGNAPEGGAASDPLPHLLANPPQRKAHWWQSQHLRRASLLRAMGSEASVSQAASPPSQVWCWLRGWQLQGMPSALKHYVTATDNGFGVAAAHGSKSAAQEAVQLFLINLRTLLCAFRRSC